MLYQPPPQEEHSSTAAAGEEQLAPTPSHRYRPSLQQPDTYQQQHSQGWNGRWYSNWSAQPSSESWLQYSGWQGSQYSANAPQSDAYAAPSDNQLGQPPRQGAQTQPDYRTSDPPTHPTARWAEEESAVEAEQGQPDSTDQRHTPGISSNPRFTTLRVETDSFHSVPGGLVTI